MSNVRSIINELLCTANEPMFIVNFNGDVECCNNRAKEFINISNNQTYKIEMDENSKTSWTSFLNNFHKKNHDTCIINLKLPDCSYKKVQIEGRLHEKEKSIFVRILKLISTKKVKRNMETVFLDDLAHGVVITNFQGKILSGNKKALQFLQCENKDIINKPHHVIFNQFEDFQFNKKKFYQELNNTGQSTIILRNNTTKEHYYKIDSKKSYKSNVVVSTITDVSKEFHLDNKLSHNFEKDLLKVTACIAHEIRNPMTCIKGFIELLKRSLTNSSDCQRYLDIMNSELNRIDGILKEVLNSAKCIKGYKKKVHLTKVVKETTEVMQPVAQTKNIMIVIKKINIHNDIAIFGNENHIKQVFINLLKNAIEVMNDGGYITIHIKNLNNGFVQLSVKDEGNGIIHDQLKNLFKPFYTTKHEGTGLGLTIVKKIIEEHQGRIHVESKLNHGTTFYIDFPIYNGNHNQSNEKNKLLLEI